MLVAFWKAWGIQSAVLLSFALQVTLLVMADVRRQMESRLVKAILWSAYVLADTTAVYALGHMSVASRSAEHELTAFWAPLLLVHLGGQNNITAYAIEDNQLWLRHLQVLGVQVLAACYVLYQSPILHVRTLLLLQPATILMFVVGVLKYGERVWALMRASNGASSSLSARCYRDFRKKKLPSTWSEEAPAPTRPGRGDTTEILLKAYLMLDVPKQMFEGPTLYVQIHDAYPCDEGEISQMVGMQLSMMYDLLYTKAAVVHTWYGWSVRVVSQLSTVAALLLFHASTANLLHGGCSRVDVIVTYVLLGGAVVLETMSTLRAVFSTWTCVLLQERGWRQLARVLQILPQSIRSAVRARYWSGSMGQHNLFGLCTRSSINLGSRIARLMGYEDLWDSSFYSWSISVSPDIINWVVKLVSKSEGVDREDPDHITNSRGRGALKRADMYADLNWTVEMDLDESILVWHIATHVYLSWYIREVKVDDTAKATGELSCYMFFLLTVRPYMLPYPVSRQRYVQLGYDLIISGQDLSRLIQSKANAQTSITLLETVRNNTLSKGCQLAANLIRRGPEMISIICEVWVEMLCYTAYRCNENSHAKHLSNGGEIMTAVALLMLYMSKGIIKTRASSH